MLHSCNSFSIISAAQASSRLTEGVTIRRLSSATAASVYTLVSIGGYFIRENTCLAITITPNNGSCFCPRPYYIYTYYIRTLKATVYSGLGSRLDICLLFIFIYYFIGTAGKLQSLWMFCNKAIYMAYTLFFQYLVDSNKNSGLFYITKAIVDSCTKELHGRT